MDIREKRKELEQAESAVMTAQDKVRFIKIAIDTLERQCSHYWGETKYTPRIIPGGYDPGDPPGTMGIDRRLPCSWPSEEIPKWTRVCTKCGKIEITERIAEEVKKIPKW